MQYNLQYTLMHIECHSQCSTQKYQGDTNNEKFHLPGGVYLCVIDFLIDFNFILIYINGHQKLSHFRHFLNSEELLINTGSSDGGPRSQVCARLTLRSAPNRHSRIFSAHMSERDEGK